MNENNIFTSLSSGFIKRGVILVSLLGILILLLIGLLWYWQAQVTKEKIHQAPPSSSIPEFPQRTRGEQDSLSDINNALDAIERSEIDLEREFQIIDRELNSL